MGIEWGRVRGRGRKGCIVVLAALAANRHAKHVALSRVAYFRLNWEIASSCFALRAARED